jgi:hypothetical protein
MENDRNTLQLTHNVNPQTLVVEARNFLISKVRLLESKGDAKLLSRPSILTVDNIGALIDLSETFYIRVTGERVAQVVPVTAGTTLRVTPRYVEKNGHRLVQLVIDIEDGRIQEQRTVLELPRVLRSSVSTEAVVAEKQSLLIGGFDAQNETVTEDRVPCSATSRSSGGSSATRRPRTRSASGSSSSRRRSSPCPTRSRRPRSSRHRPSRAGRRRRTRRYSAAMSAASRSLSAARARKTRLRTVPMGIESSVAASS